MSFFQSDLLPLCLKYCNDHLMMDDLALTDIAVEQATPFYCYSRNAIEQRLQACLTVFKSVDASVHFAVKANSNLSVLKLVAQAGLGADIVSGGELIRVIKAGIPSEKVIFSGVAKTDAEIAQAITAGIGQFNIESAEELYRIDQISRRFNCQVNATLRVNPEVEVGTHSHIATGKKGSKFGVTSNRLSELFQASAEMPHINLRGLAMHIGSQITSLEPYSEAIQKMRLWTEQLRAEGYELDILDLGGGLGVDYGDGQCLEFMTYASLVRQKLKGLNINTQVELGRSLISDAGVLVASVVSTKIDEPRNFVMLDAGMNDFLRPALYQAAHLLVPAKIRHNNPIDRVNFVGPICESTDFFLRDYLLPLPEEGDLMVFCMAGAYGAVQSSMYNSRTLIPEVMIEKNGFRVIRKPWTIEEQLALEI